MVLFCFLIRLVYHSPPFAYHVPLERRHVREVRHGHKHRIHDLAFDRHRLPIGLHMQRQPGTSLCYYTNKLNHRHLNK